MNFTISDISLYREELKIKCANWGMDKNSIPQFKVKLTNDQLKEKLQEYADILEIFRYFTEKTTMFQLNIPVFIVLNDKHGCLLDIFGEQPTKQAMELLGILQGIKFTEEDCGVNTITLCLKHQCPVQCIGNDHYHTVLHQFACYSAPIFSTVHDNEIIGCLTIMTTIDNANSLLLTLLTTISDSLTRELYVKRQNKTLDKLQKIMSTKSKNGIIVCDAKGMIIEFNTAAEQLTGHKKQNVIGGPIGILGDVALFMEDALVKGHEFNDIQYEFVNGKNESAQICLFDIFPVYDEKQELILVVFQGRDITGYRKLEERILRLEKLSLVGQLAAGVAHEIRNPLASVKGFIQILFEDPERYMKYKELVLSEIERVEKLVSNFLLVTRPTYPNKKMVNLHDFMTNTLEFLNGECMLHDISITYQNDNTKRYINVDPNQLKQVILNVIKNAIEAIGDHGAIHVFVKEKDSNIIIAIQDNGPGISECILKSIGIPFFTTKEHGTGLGLSICNQIIEAHGGKLEITSNPNVDTTISVHLPITYQP